MNEPTAPPSAPPAETFVSELERVRRLRLGPVLAGVAGLYAGLTLIWVASMIRLPTDLTFPEGQMVERATQAALGRLVYEEWRAWPHSFTPYGPLFFYPTGWAARVFSDPGDVDAMYRLGRLQSLGAQLGILLLLWFIGRDAGMSRGGRLLAMALPFTWLALMEYAVSYRPDAPAAFWTLLALWPVVRGPARRWAIVWALAATMAALWTKLTGIGFLIFIYAWIVAGQGWRRATAIMAGFGALGLGGACAYNAATGGMFFHNVVGGAVGGEGYGVGYFLRWAPQLWPRPALVLALGTAAAVYTLASKGDRRRRWPAAAALFSVVSLAPFLPKNGGDIIYFLTPYLLLNLSLAATADELWRRASPARRGLREAVLWALLIVPLTTFAVRDLHGWIARMRSLRSGLEKSSITDAIEGRYERGPILSVVNYTALKWGTEPTVLDHFAYTAVLAHGGLDAGPLLDRVRGERFDLVLLHWGSLDLSGADEERVFGRDFLPVLLEHYEVVDRPMQFVLLKPRHRSIGEKSGAR
jgi:hypothetical protein